MSEVFVGKYTGHGSPTALNVGIGFQPDWVDIYTNGTTAGTFVWAQLEGAGLGQLTQAAAAANGSEGVTQYDGGDIVTALSDAAQDGAGNQIAVGATQAAGFTIGAAAGINVDGETFYFKAYRNAPPTAEIPYRIDGSTVVHTTEDEN